MTSSPTVASVDAPLVTATAQPNVVGFRKAVNTPFDSTISRYMDATSVLVCQLMDEIVRDLLGEVSHYGIPDDATCDDFYAWLENAGTKSIDKNLAMFSTVITSVGMGVPDNMQPQLDALRESVKGVLRAAFDPVCTSGASLAKDVVMTRLKELQGVLCGANASADAGGPWPKFETDPLTGAQTIVTKDGTRIGLNLDNSADNTNNLSNMINNDGGEGKLDPNVLAALLLANSRPQPPAAVAPPDDGTGDDGGDAADPVDVDTGLITGPLVAPTPTLAPMPTMFGVGPLGCILVLGLAVFIVAIAWNLWKMPKAAGDGGGGGAPVAPRNVTAGLAGDAAPR